VNTRTLSERPQTIIFINHEGTLYMIEIFELNQKQERLEEAILYFWKQWGTENNFSFYKDCMIHSLQSDVILPKFYIALMNDEIVGTYAILRNDLISRQDLEPWFACLFVYPDYRGQELGIILQKHACEEMKEKGFTKLYLATTLKDYYEKYGWNYMNEGYYFNGDKTKIYIRDL
jgi:GNAT superfamily N-acetyltransferase